MSPQSLDTASTIRYWYQWSKRTMENRSIRYISKAWVDTKAWGRKFGKTQLPE
jgi:hypothetical protein